MLKIVTWNLMRPNTKTYNRNSVFHETLRSLDADIIVLTETNGLMDLGNDYFLSKTKALPSDHEGFPYSDGENRTTIYSKYPFTRHFNTYDEYTAVCSEVLTPFGHLIIYGTIMGVTGGKDSRFKSDFEKQMMDIVAISQNGSTCVAGDLNITLSGYAYPSHAIINDVNDFFEDNAIEILTRNISDTVDHIAISQQFLVNLNFETERLPFDKKITDHNLVIVTLEKQ